MRAFMEEFMHTGYSFADRLRARTATEHWTAVRAFMGEFLHACGPLYRALAERAQAVEIEFPRSAASGKDILDALSRLRLLIISACYGMYGLREPRVRIRVPVPADID